MQKEFDVIIIGGGVVGSAVARELSKYRLSIAVLERELDVCYGTSGRNTGLLHSGILQSPGTLSAECCTEANRNFDELADHLGIPFKRCGKLFVGYEEADKERLLKLKHQGEENSVPGLKMLDEEELHRMEPHVYGICALFVPSAGILDPFSYTIGLAENAAENGVRYYFDEEVTGIVKTDGQYAVTAGNDIFKGRWVINCAGLMSWKVSQMLGYRAYVPDRVKGEYIILDKRVGEKLGHPIYPAPDDTGACDIHVTPTIDGNILVGPTLEKIGPGCDYDATARNISYLSAKGARMFDEVKRENYIRNFVGNFPAVKDPGTGAALDFVIEADPLIPHTVNLVNMTSPALTSAVPIARRVVLKMMEQESFTENGQFNPVRKRIVRFADQDPETQEQLIREDPDYGEIFCRCECVSKAEIRRAIHNILGVHTVAGIKYRTRASMGRCQGGYCETRITAMLQSELGLKKTDIRLNRKDAYMFVGEVKSREEE